MKLQKSLIIGAGLMNIFGLQFSNGQYDELLTEEHEIEPSVQIVLGEAIPEIDLFPSHIPDLKQPNIANAADELRKSKTVAELVSMLEKSPFNTRIAIISALGMFQDDSERVVNALSRRRAWLGNGMRTEFGDLSAERRAEEGVIENVIQALSSSDKFPTPNEVVGNSKPSEAVSEAGHKTPQNAPIARSDQLPLTGSWIYVVLICFTFSALLGLWVWRTKKS